MKPENFLPATESRLEKAKSNFEDWRSSRKNRSRIPEALWKKAVALYPEYTVGKISSTLRLSYTDLKKRINSSIEPDTNESESVPAFIEVGFSAASSSLSECIVEMEDGHGAKMRMCFKGKTDFDLMELSRSFWRKDS